MPYYSQNCSVHLGNPGQEDSFDYILRHTHHRARDVQKFARVCVETFAEEKNKSLDDVLHGRGGAKISQSCIRQVVREESRRMADLLEAEGARRFTILHRLLDELRGLTVPFTVQDLNGRVARLNGIDVNSALDMLWWCGVIGVVICAKDPRHVQDLREKLGDDTLRQYQLGGGVKVCAWFLFEYSWSGRGSELIARHENSDQVDAKLILHPQLFEHLNAHPDRDIPYGA